MRIEKLWLSAEGKNTLLQKPNLPLIVWAVCFVLAKLLPYGQANFIAELVSYGSIFTWAWLEVFDGDSPARRLLGVFVMLMTIFSRI